MITLNLWRAEWLKARKRPANLIMLFSLHSITFIFVVSVVIIALVKGGSFVKDSQELLNFPRSLDLSANTLSGFAKLLAIIFVANSIGSEYGQDTWKMILPRYGSRSTFLLIKLLLGIAAMFILFLSTNLLWVIFSAIGALILRVNIVSSPVMDSVILSYKFMGLNMIEMMIYGSITFLITIITRSTVGGIIGGLFVWIGFGIASQLPFRAITLMLPNTHINNLYGNFLSQAGLVSRVNEIFGQPIRPVLSLLLLTCYFLIFIVTALYIFYRRDMA